MVLGSAQRALCRRNQHGSKIERIVDMIHVLSAVVCVLSTSQPPRRQCRRVDGRLLLGRHRIFRSSYATGPEDSSPKVCSWLCVALGHSRVRRFSKVGPACPRLGASRRIITVFRAIMIWVTAEWTRLANTKTPYYFIDDHRLHLSNRHRRRTSTSSVSSEQAGGRP